MAPVYSGCTARLKRRGSTAGPYDFHGSNPIARRLTGLDTAAKMTTRRWFYVIPASGEPLEPSTRFEPHNLDHLPGSKTIGPAARDAVVRQSLSRSSVA